MGLVLITITLPAVLKRSDIHTRNTRSCNNLNIPKYRIKTVARVLSRISLPIEQLRNRINQTLTLKAKAILLNSRKTTNQLASDLRHVAPERLRWHYYAFIIIFIIQLVNGMTVRLVSKYLQLSFHTCKQSLKSPLGKFY